MLTISRMAAALAGAALLSMGGAEAKTLVSYNFTKNNFSHAQYAACLSGPVSGGCNAAIIDAVPFTPMTNGTLDHLDLALANVGLATGSNLGTGVAVALVQDGGTGAPSKVAPAMEVWNIAKIPLYSTPNFKATKVTSKLHPALIKNKKYWIVVTPIEYDEYAFWMLNTISDRNYSDSYDGGTTWHSETIALTPAFDVWIQ